jgi:hypothetical protein
MSEQPTEGQVQPYTDEELARVEEALPYLLSRSPTMTSVIFQEQFIRALATIRTLQARLKAVEGEREKVHYWQEQHMDYKGRYMTAIETLHEIVQQSDAPTVNNITFIKWLARKALENLEAKSK